MSFFKNFKTRASGFLNFAKGYDAAKLTRALRNWKPSFGSPDGEIILDLPKLRAYCRDLYRNNAIARGAIELMVTNVIGRGLKVEPAMDREIIQKYNGWDEQTTIDFCNVVESRLKKDFNAWAESKESDIRGQRNFYANQQLAYKSILASGEVFPIFGLRKHANTLFNFRFGLIEADQVQTPGHSIINKQNRDGIEFNEEGSPIGVWVNMNQETYPYEFKFIPFYGENSGRPLILHLYKADRPGQSRGVPFLTPVIQVLKHLEDYKRSELIRAKVAGLFAVFIKSSNPNALDQTITDPEQDSSTVSSQGRDFKMGAGSVHQLSGDESIEFANPGNISSNYEPLANSLYTEIGMPLRIPLELLRRYYGASYSASRGAKNDYLKEVSIEREMVELDLCIPTYKEWVIEQVLAGRYKLPGFWANRKVQEAYLGSMWTGDAAGLIDPVKEIQASDMKVASGYSTKTEETAALTGGDYEANLRIRKREIEIEKKNGVDKLQPTAKTTSNSQTGSAE